MEIIYNIGMVCLLKSSGMAFVVFNNVLSDPSIDVIGCYQDKNKIIKRIKRESRYGQEIISLLNPIPEILSQNQVELKKVIDMLINCTGMPSNTLFNSPPDMP